MTGPDGLFMVNRGQKDREAAGVTLTKRELEVFWWIQKGKTGWEIATILQISTRTVKFHVQNVLVKLGAATRAQAVAIALKLDLMEP